MDQKEIDKVVNDFRKSTCDVSDEEVSFVLRLCERKMEVAGKPDVYMGLLLPDELKNHCFRKVVNAVSSIRETGKEQAKCAACVS